MAWIEEWSNAHPSAAFLITVLLIPLILLIFIKVIIIELISFGALDIVYEEHGYTI